MFAKFPIYFLLGPCAVKPDGSLDLSYYGVDTGLYHTHLERWYRHFNRDQVHTFHFTAYSWQEKWRLLIPRGIDN
jgi:hypothetical protein